MLKDYKKISVCALVVLILVMSISTVSFADSQTSFSVDYLAPLKGSLYPYSQYGAISNTSNGFVVTRSNSAYPCAVTLSLDVDYTQYGWIDTTITSAFAQPFTFFWKYDPNSQIAIRFDTSSSSSSYNVIASSLGVGSVSASYYSLSSSDWLNSAYADDICWFTIETDAAFWSPDETAAYSTMFRFANNVTTSATGTFTSISPIYMVYGDKNAITNAYFSSIALPMTQITIPSGYACLIQKLDTEDISFYLTSSHTATERYGNRGNTSGHRIIPTDTIIDSGSFDGLGSLVHWWIPQDLQSETSWLKQSHIGSTPIETFSTKYVYITNPVKPRQGVAVSNGDVHVHFDGGGLAWVKLIPLTASVDQALFGGDYGFDTIDTEAQAYDYVANFDTDGNVVETGFIKTDSITSSAIVLGDTSYVLDSVNSTTNVGTDELINHVSSLSHRGESSISQLLSGSSNFFSSLRQLYSWLPSDLMILIGSALVVFLVVAIIKLFL